MPKTKKRSTTKRATRIAKAHATQLPPLEVKEAPRRAPGYKSPARGLARYPWLITLSLLVIAVAIGSLYYYHIGPFAKPAKPKPQAVASPCLKVVKQLTNLSPAPGPETFNSTPHTFKQAPDMVINTKKVYCAGINTNRGLIVLELDPKLAPNTVNNFVFLAQQHFYDGQTFHRVVPHVIIQTGSPTGTSQGGPGYKFNDEPVKGKYTVGMVAMANAGPNTNGSQFFICTGDDSKTFKSLYNLFGHVVRGLNVAQAIQGPGDTPVSKSVKADVITHLIVVVAP
jgi:peptidylprolyl isomerase